MSEVVIDASLALQWFLEDELDRDYSLRVLQSLTENSAIVPFLWFYEVGNGLTVACRRKRITTQQADAYFGKLRGLPVTADTANASVILNLAHIARQYDLTVYDAAYLELAIRRKIALATTDNALGRAAKKAGVPSLNT